MTQQSPPGPDPGQIPARARSGSGLIMVGAIGFAGWQRKEAGPGFGTGHDGTEDGRRMKALQTAGGAGQMAVLGLAGAAVIGGALWYGWPRPDPAGVPTVVPAEQSAPGQPLLPAGESMAATVATDTGPTDIGPTDIGPSDTAPADILPVEIAPPEITTWLVTGTGDATIGGLGEPGAVIGVLLDGTLIAKATVTRDGEFALVTGLAPNPNPALLSLVMETADGRRIPSAGVIAIGPVGGAVADAPADTGDSAARQAGITAEAPAAPDAPVALMISDAGVTVLQPPAAAQPEDASQQAGTTPSFAVATVSYDAPDVMVIGGTGAAGSFVRLYLDNQAVGADPVQIGAGGSWQAELSGLAPGAYLLRADQLDGAGAVTARFETPIRRETPEALAQLSAAKPASDLRVAQGAATDSATAIPLTPGALPDASLPPGSPDTAPAAPAAVTITVQPGHTLWAIARDEFGEGVLYVQLFEANRDRIRDPDLIYPGQVFTLPGR
ncbi:LysM peptidoglycan-binding domain-containing protein [Xinfangfangia sp. D13-10-4-6]|uniref:LysM peptidoglycan-binding domain-containing protein n=1 Tax=Pseudogemmobacter hezensis TaxID=2737662 RepID=UPI001554CCF0|nr:LysM peptidoglycan-binding domain-containing protein [Pseudogemmobacter hezensis]NPD13703.1 LysM peptidoglycan-binding domain-containing protein [Pseudogemmobacter hezensis]